MADLKDTVISTTGHITMPVGTVAERPSPPVTGMIRLCTDFPGYTSAVIEYYDGTDWKSLYTPVATGNGGTLTVTGGFNIHTYTSTGSSVFEVVQE
jgi:hypothetical protein